MTAYEPPSGPQQQWRPVTTSGFAIASLVLGIVWGFWIGSILALIFGYIALRQIKRSQGSLSGRGMAIAGVVLGWVGVGLLVVTIALAVVGYIAGPAPVGKHDYASGRCVNFDDEVVPCNGHEFGTITHSTHSGVCLPGEWYIVQTSTGTTWCIEKR